MAGPDSLGWGRAWTDEQGLYEFRTVLPGGHADATGRRAPHVDLTALGAGLMRRVLTTVFFPGFPDENAPDPVLALVPEPLRWRLVARPDGEAEGSRVFRFDVRLRGGPDEKTPFFENR